MMLIENCHNKLRLLTKYIQYILQMGYSQIFISFSRLLS